MADKSEFQYAVKSLADVIQAYADNEPISRETLEKSLPAHRNYDFWKKFFDELLDLQDMFISRWDTEQPPWLEKAREDAKEAMQDEDQG